MTDALISLELNNITLPQPNHKIYQEIFDILQKLKETKPDETEEIKRKYFETLTFSKIDTWSNDSSNI